MLVVLEGGWVGGWVGEGADRVMMAGMRAPDAGAPEQAPSLGQGGGALRGAGRGGKGRTQGLGQGGLGQVHHGFWPVRKSSSTHGASMMVPLSSASV